jgi:hypothetical protein
MQETYSRLGDILTDLDNLFERERDAHPVVAMEINRAMLAVTQARKAVIDADPGVQ